MEKDFDFSIFEEGVELGVEMNPLLFDEGDYTPIETILEHVLSNEEPKVDAMKLLAQLSNGGKVVDDEMDVYLKTKACSSNALKEALKSPLHYLIATEEPDIREDKNHFNLGTFCHLAFLQPELFDTLVTEPQASRSTKEGINTLTAFWEKICREVQKETGRKIIKYARARRKKKGLDPTKMDGAKYYIDELKRLSGKESIDARNYAIVNLIKRNYYAYGGGIIPRLLKGALFETSMYYKDPETLLPCKIRPDAAQLEENIGCNAIISFKTTHADSIQKFKYDAAKYLYHLSEGMYLEGFEAATGRKCGAVICVMLQTVSPFLPAVLMYSPEDLANGKYRYRTALRNVREAIDKESWPGFDSYAEAGHYGIIQMELPEWSRKELLSQSFDV